MNELSVFQNEQFGQIRTVFVDGDVWFVAKDVCDVLTYSNHSKAIEDHVEYEDKLNNESLSSIGQRGGWLINESGLYCLILKSNKSEAKAFKKWVTSEILPSIRKNGGYLAPTVDFSNPETMMKLLSNWAEDRKKLEQAQLQIVESAPKVDFYNAVTDSKDTIDMSQVAKVLNMKIGRNKLFALLREQGVLMDNNEPMQSYVDRGWFRQIECKYVKDGDVRIYIKTVVFQKGVDGIRKILLQVRGDA